jgi:hypothetical protein
VAVFGTVVMDVTALVVMVRPAMAVGVSSFAVAMKLAVDRGVGADAGHRVKP